MCANLLALFYSLYLQSYPLEHPPVVATARVRQQRRAAVPVPADISGGRPAQLLLRLHLSSAHVPLPARQEGAVHIKVSWLALDMSLALQPPANLTLTLAVCSVVSLCAVMLFGAAMVVFTTYFAIADLR